MTRRGGAGREQLEQLRVRERERGYSYSRQPGGKGAGPRLNPLEISLTSQLLLCVPRVLESVAKGEACPGEAHPMVVAFLGRRL